VTLVMKCTTVKLAIGMQGIGKFRMDAFVDRNEATVIDRSLTTLHRLCPTAALKHAMTYWVTMNVVIPPTRTIAKILTLGVLPTR
jgi:hypothetical protein